MVNLLPFGGQTGVAHGCVAGGFDYRDKVHEIDTGACPVAMLTGEVRKRQVPWRIVVS